MTRRNDEARRGAPRHGRLPSKVAAAAFWAVAGVALLAWATGALDAVSLSGLAEHREHLERLVAQRPAAAVAVYVILFIVLTGLGLPVALTLTLAGGALLGPVLGGAATVAGATGGAALTYAATRSTIGPWIASRAARSKRLEPFMRRARDDPFALMLAARLMPLFPFTAVNVAAGLASLPWRPFVAATGIGAIPSSFIYSALGAGLDRTLTDAAPAAALARSPDVLWPLAALAVLALAPLLVRRLRRRPPSGPPAP